MILSKPTDSTNSILEELKINDMNEKKYDFTYYSLKKDYCFNH